MYNVKTQMSSKKEKKTCTILFPHLTMQNHWSLSHGQLTNKAKDCLYQLTLSSKTTSEHASVRKKLKNDTQSKVTKWKGLNNYPRGNRTGIFVKKNACPHVAKTEYRLDGTYQAKRSECQQLYLLHGIIYYTLVQQVKLIKAHKINKYSLHTRLLGNYALREKTFTINFVYKV
jgi:hypothetical protein